jgi:hypothetical protein
MSQCVSLAPEFIDLIEEIDDLFNGRTWLKPERS